MCHLKVDGWFSDQQNLSKELLMIIEFAPLPTLRAAYIENKGRFEASIMIAAKAAADSMGPRFSGVYYRSARELLTESKRAA